MSQGGNLRLQGADGKVRHSFRDPSPVRIGLTVFVVLFFGVIVVLPLALVFSQALGKGIAFYFEALTEPAAMSAIQLTLTVAAFVVPLNTVFGLAAAWAIAKFDFPGKTFFITLMDLPFAVSPVIAGLIFVLALGRSSPIGAFLSEHGLRIIFSTPGIVIATIFVTFPFVARELIPLMQSLGNEEEEAAIILGASGFQTFLKVTLPNIKWGLLYGMILCNARAIGEFGAVSVVSGHIRGLTNTIPLHVEILYSEYNFSAAFAVSSLLVLIAVLTLLVKLFVEWRMRKESISRAEVEA